MSQGAPETHAFEFQPQREDERRHWNLQPWLLSVGRAVQRRPAGCSARETSALDSVFGWLELRPEVTGRRLSSKSESPCSPTPRGCRRRHLSSVSLLLPPRLDDALWKPDAKQAHDLNTDLTGAQGHISSQDVDVGRRVATLDTAPRQSCIVRSM